MNEGMKLYYSGATARGLIVLCILQLLQGQEGREELTVLLLRSSNVTEVEWFNASDTLLAVRHAKNNIMKKMSSPNEMELLVKVSADQSSFTDNFV